VPENALKELRGAVALSLALQFCRILDPRYLHNAPLARKWQVPMPGSIGA